MLQAIRERAQGWIAWLIVILISIPFALWGIQSYTGFGGEPEAAIVNGTRSPNATSTSVSSAPAWSCASDLALPIVLSYSTTSSYAARSSTT